MRRTFSGDLRQQMARDTESSPIRRLRRYVATGSMVSGIISLALVAPMIQGAVSWAAAPGVVLMLAGAVLGASAYFEDDVGPSRRRGKYAAMCTVVGLAGVLVIRALT